jgi:ADP-heptose:LPS heptosyltransferase
VRIGYAIGGGVGNLVHTTPTIAALKSMGIDLTLWCGCNWPEAERFIDHDKIVLGEPLDPAAFDRFFVGPQALIRKGGGWEYPPGETSPMPWDQTPEVEVNMWFARLLGYEGLTPLPHILHATETPVQGDYVVIAPGVQKADPVWLKKLYRRWPEVAKRLIDNRIQVILLGSEGDHAEIPGTLNLCGKLGLWDASGVLYRARAVLAVDNGLSCLSAAMDVPTIVLWGPTHMVKNRKYGAHVCNMRLDLPCRPCQFTQSDTLLSKMHECAEQKCMDIPPEAVVAKTLAYMVQA